MFTTAPILILIVIVLGFITISRVIKNSNTKILTSSRIYIILAGYFILLFISVGVFLVSPYPKSSVINEETNTDKKPIMYGIAFDILEEGIPIDSFSSYKDDEWEFKLSGNELVIESAPNDSFEISIIVEFKDEADGIVEVAAYSSPSRVSEVDISSLLNPTTVKWIEGKRLEIKEPYGDINVVSYSKEFIFNLFSKDNKNDNDMFFGPQVEIGENILYIRVPKDVKIDNYEYLNIDVIGD